jgi:hypothetical protein
MHVLYRLCPYGNILKRRPVTGGKQGLIECCYPSFLKAFEKIRPQVVFILDKPNPWLVDLVSSCPFPHQIESYAYPDLSQGNTQTFHRQLDLAADMDKVFFLEDDYYLLPECGEALEKAIDELEVVTPYDHPGYYSEQQHDYPRTVKVVGNHHWQTVSSTCLTFATIGKFIKQEIDCMKKYGWADHPMWLDLTQRHKLWAPIPSLATHMEIEVLAPVVDWWHRWI